MTIFSTWTTYGTWLRGDPRGWFLPNRGLQPSSEPLFQVSQESLAETPIFLSDEQRSLVESVMLRHYKIRKWHLFAHSCRTNHVHVLIHTPEIEIEIPREQLKAWTTRELKNQTDPNRIRWWTEDGWDIYIEDNDEIAINEITAYIHNQ